MSLSCAASLVESFIVIIREAVIPPSVNEILLKDTDILYVIEHGTHVSERGKYFRYARHWQSLSRQSEELLIEFEIKVGYYPWIL